MPKRIVDGDALWCSEKLLNVSEKFRVEYAWILSLAQANGCFECSPLLVWRTCYSALRDDYTMKMVGEMLDAFETAKMLFRWKDKEGKTFGFFVGSQKEGRLPSDSIRLKSGRQWQAGMLPEKQLAKFLGLNPKNLSRDYQGLLQSSSRVAPDENGSDSRMGIGLGIGNGLGSGIGSGEGHGLGHGEGIGQGNGCITPTPVSNTSPSNTSPNNTSTQPNTSTPNTTTQKPWVFAEDELNELAVDELKLSTADDKFSNMTPKGFAMMFRLLMYDNPYATDTPKNWESMWEPDFKKMLETSSEIEVAGIIAVSQMKDGNKRCYVRSKSLLDGMVPGEMLHTQMGEKAKILPKLRMELYKTMNRLASEHKVF